MDKNNWKSPEALYRSVGGMAIPHKIVWVSAGFLAALLAMVLCFCLSGCGSGDGNKRTGQESLIYLDYATGVDKNGNYNDELYGMNINNVSGADPGVFYVSEEEDPVYGGYYYMYVTGSLASGRDMLTSEYYQENKIRVTAFLCYRSRNLYQWERCGALGGYSLQVEEEDWCSTNFWAPEVVRNPADGNYYQYFSVAPPEDYGVKTLSSSDKAGSRYCLGVAVSESPMGPFRVLYELDSETGKRIPTINFKTGCGTEDFWAAIDASPFFDDDGELYLYFRAYAGDQDGLYGMRMKTMSQPDYATVTCLAMAGKESVSSVQGSLGDVTPGEDYYSSESGVNEGPFMFKQNGTYYLTYSSNGYTSSNYSVHQAIGDSPLGKFCKLDASEGNPVLDGGLFGYMNGTAHHSFVQNGNELWIIYHRHDSIFGFDAGWGRSVSTDRVSLVENGVGQKVLTADGPSKCLQWLPENVSGYKNLAQTATVQISAGTGVEYLVDTVLPYYDVSQDYKMSVEGDVTITLKWDKPVKVSSLMIYNAREADKAFSKISDIRFNLAEQPEWAGRAYDAAVIKNLTFPEQYYDPESEEYITCAPAVAEFDPILVSEIRITIKAEDRLVKKNKFGEQNMSLNLSEIVVLGGVDSNE